MSSGVYQNLVLPRSIMRDFIYTSPAGTLGEVHDTPQCWGIIGTDLFIRNRGAAALTIAVNGPASNVVTVDPGDVYLINDTQFTFVQIVSAVIYDFQVFGVRIATLRKMRLIR